MESGEAYDVEKMSEAFDTKEVIEVQETVRDVSSMFKVCEYCQSLLFGEEEKQQEHIDGCRKISLRIRR